MVRASHKTRIPCLGLVALAGAVLLTATGCAVPQPRGQGKLDKLTEPTTGRHYYLYLPKDYVEASETERARERWPVIVTFHGLKPYDIAYYQAREWEYEADRYGYIVIAPVLKAPDSLFGQFPQRTVTGAFKSDEEATVAILEHVFDTTRADPSNVLSTGFSSGGYMAHYMVNRHPDLFTCVASRQANFSASILDPKMTSRSRYHPVLILTTKNDLGICQRESQEGIKWYESHGYKNLAWIHINHLGHERTPDIAAEFFARVSGVEAKWPPDVLVQRQAIDGNQTGLELLAGDLSGLERRSDRRRSRSNRNSTTQQPSRHRARAERSRRVADERETVRVAQSNDEPSAAISSPLGISVSSAIGFEPLRLVYAAECPADWYRTASFRWTLDGQLIGEQVNGQKTISAPGDYRLELLVTTAEGAEHRAGRRIRVLRDTDTPTAGR